MEVGLVVDLVKGHPVLHFMLIAGEDDPAKRTKKSISLRLRQPPYSVTGDKAFQNATA